MSYRLSVVPASVAALLACSTQALAQTRTLNSGSTIYQQTGDFTATTGDSRLGTGGIFDQLFANTWYFRTGSFNGVRIFSSLVTPSYTQEAANVGSWRWLNNGAGPTDRFDATLRISLNEVAPGAAQVLNELTLTNRTATAVTFNIFNRIDLDLSGTNTDDRIAAAQAPGVLAFRQSDASTNFANIAGFGADRFAVNTSTNIRNLFPTSSFNAGTILNLNNTVTNAGPADLAVALQWTFTLNPSESFSLASSFAINAPAIPAPGAAGLLLAGGALAARRRRR